MRERCPLWFISDCRARIRNISFVPQAKSQAVRLQRLTVTPGEGIWPRTRKSDETHLDIGLVTNY